MTYDPILKARVALVNDLVKLLPGYGFKTAAQQAKLAGLSTSNWHAVLRCQRSLPKKAWDKILAGALGPIPDPKTPDEIRFRAQQQATYDKWAATFRKPGEKKPLPGSHPGLAHLESALSALDGAEASKDIQDIKWLIGDARDALDKLKLEL